MWVMTLDGFYSAVQHNDDPDLLVVRTRARADATRLSRWYADWKSWRLFHGEDADATPEPRILAYARSDYPWRIMVPRRAWGDYLTDSLDSLTYGNFKDAVAGSPLGPARAKVYGRVWEDLLAVEQEDSILFDRLRYGEEA